MKCRMLAMLLLLCMLLVSVPFAALPAAAAEENGELVTIDDYLNAALALEPKSEYQRALRGEMLFEYATIKEEIADMTEDMQMEVAAGLLETHMEYLRDYKYGEIESTPYVMTFAYLSDVHVNVHVKLDNNTGAFKEALQDILDYNRDPAGVFVLGDLSDNGVTPNMPNRSDLNVYYDFLDSYTYKNSKGEDIPITSILGNHDVRGWWNGSNYPSGAYEAAVEMYLEREGVDSLLFDRWINGYHFIMINPARYSTDDCLLTAENIRWLDEKLSENEDGRPIFVMVHQFNSRVQTDSDSPYTFDELIARHPSAVVSSGHGHYGFDDAFVYQQGQGHYVNQPSLVGNTGMYSGNGYYIVDVYEGGAIFRARNLSDKTWVPEADVLVPNEGGYQPKGTQAYYFYDYNGALLSKGTADTGSALTAPAAPKRESDAQFTYTFAGWDLDGDGVADTLPTTLDKNISATAVYTATTRQYTYVFYDADGKTELRKMTTEYGGVFRVPGVRNLLGWDIDGDGAVEDLPAGVPGAFSAVAVIKDAAKSVYSFIDEDGYVIQKGQVGAGEKILLPTDEEITALHPGDYFVGWDSNGDGEPDALPTGDLTGDMTFVAIYYKASEVQQFWNGTTDDLWYYMEIQGGRRILTTTDTTYLASPSGHAVFVDWNGEKKYSSNNVSMSLPLPYAEQTPTGYAVWIDAPEANGSYSFSLYKNRTYVHDSGTAAKGDIYLLNADGKMTKQSINAEITLPKGFSGWLIVPMDLFGRSASLVGRDTLSFVFARKETIALKKSFYFGDGLSYTCTTEEMIAHLQNGYTAYYDEAGGLLSVTYGKADAPTAKASYETEIGTYTFAGWDLNGDGVADVQTPTASGTVARAAYTFTPKNLTYRFVDAAGKVYYEKQAVYGTVILPPDVVNLDGVNFTLTHIDYQNGDVLMKDTTYLVSVVSDRPFYTVKFVADGTVVWEGSLVEGSTITAPAVPDKEGYTGTWTGYTEGMKVSAAHTFEASYTANASSGGGGCSSSIGSSAYGWLALCMATVAFVVSKKRRTEE